MKRSVYYLMFIVLLATNGTYAQSPAFNEGTPLKTMDSPLFGKDIILNDQPTQNQRKVAICSAFNGWIYAVYSHPNPSNHMQSTVLLKSIDGGITWAVLNDYLWAINGYFNSLDIAVTGDSIENLKVFICAVVAPYDNPSHLGSGIVWQFDPLTGAWVADLGGAWANYMCFASDILFPSINSNPQSLGILYSTYSTSNDSIIFLSSGNGGASFNNRQVISVKSAQHYFGKVSLCYGRSPSWSSGRYFAAWEEKLNFNSSTGFIYTAHSEPNINSPFTTPIRLDTPDTSLYGRSRNPSIACQYNGADNDSANFTEVILFDKFDTSSQRYDITGYYNLQAANHTNFQKLTLSNVDHYNLQPSINFNPFDGNFMVTYYDSTTQKLPFITNNFNLATPDTWQYVTTAYNDSSNLEAPYPKVALNLAQHKGMNAWLGERTGGNGIAMFDSPYSTWTGISGNSNNELINSYKVYPNPCASTLNIAFNLEREENVNITIYNTLGKPVGIVANQKYPKGSFAIKVVVSNLSPGSYQIVYKNDDSLKSCKVIVIR